MLTTAFHRSLTTAREKNLSLGTLQVLGIIVNSPNATLTDIRDQLNISTSAVTNLADTLEKLGYATRRHSTEDRRKIHLIPTNDGIAALAQISSTP